MLGLEITDLILTVIIILHFSCLFRECFQFSPIEYNLHSDFKERSGLFQVLRKSAFNSTSFKPWNTMPIETTTPMCLVEERGNADIVCQRILIPS